MDHEEGTAAPVSQSPFLRSLEIGRDGWELECGREEKERDTENGKESERRSESKTKTD